MTRIVFHSIPLLMASAMFAQNGKVLTVWIDRSGSPNHLEKLAPALERVIRTASPPLRGIEACPFGLGDGSSWIVPCKRFDWGSEPSIAQPDVKPQGIANIFRTSREATAEEVQRKFDGETQKRLDEYKAAISMQLRSFTAYLVERPGKVPPCTRFEDLATRVEAQNRELNLIITDGLMDCSDAPSTGASESLSGKIVILLVPAKKDMSGGSEQRRFVLRDKGMRKLFPSATVVASFAVDKIGELFLGTTSGKNVAASPTPFMENIKAAGNGQENTTKNTYESRAKTGHRDTLANLESRLRDFLTQLHSRYVPLSFGPYEGECFTERMLQEMISSNQPERIAGSLKADRKLIDIASDVKKLPEGDRDELIAKYRSFATHKTWTELGIPPGPTGQTVAGLQAEHLLSKAVVDLLEQMTGS